MQTRIAKAADVVEGHLVRVTICDIPVLLTRIGGEVVAFSERCPHLGFSLA